MDIKTFAEQYRLRVNDWKHEGRFKLETSEDTIQGRYGEIVDDPSYGPVFAVKFIAVPRNANMNGALRNRYQKALAGGLSLKRKYGDAESTFHFDPTNAEQVTLALRLAGVKTKKRMAPPSPAQLAARERFAQSRRALSSK